MSPSPQKHAGPSELHRVIFSPLARACMFLKNYAIDFIGIAPFACFVPAGTAKFDFSRGRRGQKVQKVQKVQAGRPAMVASNRLRLARPVMTTEMIDGEQWRFGGVRG